MCQDTKNKTKSIGIFPIGRGEVCGYKLLVHNKSCCQKSINICYHVILTCFAFNSIIQFYRKKVTEDYFGK